MLDQGSMVPGQILLVLGGEFYLDSIVRMADLAEVGEA